MTGGASCAYTPSKARPSSSRRGEHYLPALQAAIAVDPIRETAHRIVIEVHIAEGNVAGAIKRYHDYRAFLRRELKVVPSPQMTRLVQNLLPA